jgi:hypothetical protein
MACWVNFDRDFAVLPGNPGRLIKNEMHDGKSQARISVRRIPYPESGLGGPPKSAQVEKSRLKC